MPFWDPQMKKSPKQYLIQCLLATVSVFFLFLILDLNQHGAIISTIGATIFVVFSLPHSYSSQPRRILGGYFWGTVVGILAYYIVLFTGGSSLSSVSIGALAAGLTLFFMAATNSEHPPAAGLAVGLIYNLWQWETLLVIWGAIIYLSLLRVFLASWLIDLTAIPSPQRIIERGKKLP